MFLTPWYRYVWLDFETTWLDHLKDEAIQIALVELDSEWTIIKEFSTLLKPAGDVKKIKDIVTFITGLSVADLEDAPTIEDCREEILSFFDEKTVLIWHNVWFDLQFLRKYFPDVPLYTSVDTFILAQSIIHHAQSYALEVLVQHLQNQPLFVSFFTKYHDWATEKHHDALYDTKNSLALFSYFYTYILSLTEKYPILWHFIWRTPFPLAQFVNPLLLPKQEVSPKLFSLPPLQKLAPSQVTLQSMFSIDLNTYPSLQRYYIWNMDFKTLLEGILSNKKVLLAFSNNAKLDIAKNMLHDMWIKNIGFAKEEQVINQEKFAAFVQKKSFTQEEFLFLCKYISHLVNGYWVLDLNNKYDHQIYYTLKDAKETVHYPVVITTHAWLFSLLDAPNHVYADYTICFFDVEYRYKSYNFYLSRPCDLYYTLNFLDMLLYKYTTLASPSLPWLESFRSFFETFMGVLFIETKQLFTHTQDIFIQINPLIGNTAFHQTNQLLSQLQEYIQELSSLLLPEDFAIIEKQLQHFLKVCWGLLTVSKKMYSASDFYFLYAETSTFTNWNEFTDRFQHTQTLFFSLDDTSYTPLLPATPEPERLPMQTIRNIPDILVYLEQEISSLAPNTSQTYFILSIKKDQSKDLFDKLYAQPYMKGTTLLIENITWWSGKNMFKAKSPWIKVIIWWYNFLLQFYANRLPIDKVIVFYINGPQEHYLLHDLSWYAPKSS